MLIDMLDLWGRRVVAEVSIGRDTVEVRCGDGVVGTAERERLRAWLIQPGGVYAYDEVAWLGVGDGVALAIDNLMPAWVLSDQILAGLRERV